MEWAWPWYGIGDSWCCGCGGFAHDVKLTFGRCATGYSPSPTASAFGGPGWTCVLATLTCMRADILAAGASYPALTLTVNVALNAPPSLLNTAIVQGGGDSDPSNNSDDPVLVLGQAVPLPLDAGWALLLLAGLLGWSARTALARHPRKTGVT